MARTALLEQFGAGIDQVISADFPLRLPSGFEGCARMYLLRPDTVSLGVILPPATGLRIGGPLFVIANKGTQSLQLQDQNTDAVATIAVDAAVQVYLLDNSTAEGTWLTRSLPGVEISGPLDSNLEDFDIQIGSLLNFNVRTYCEQVFGYDGTTPARAQVTILEDSVIGSSTTSEPAFDTGTWPAGSIVKIILRAGSYITGKGGDGGFGGTPLPGLLAGLGANGGDGIRVKCETLLINYGSIQGGGGGGGGHEAVGTSVGSGGGGGAGYEPSRGGNQGTLTSGGFPGNLNYAGPGGGILSGGFGGFGGNGGGPGANGSTASPGSSGAPGLAGNAIYIDSGLGGSLTKIVTGTIQGAEVTV